MQRLDPRFQIKAHPQCRPESVVQGEHYRFTVLTPGLIRMEWSDDGVFEDRATQSVWNRDFPAVPFRVIDTGDELQILTSAAHLTYNKQRFTRSGLRIALLGNASNYHSTWYYGDEIEGLRGTARTLDRANGAIPLEAGVLSKEGFSVVDDSRSMLIAEDGWVEPRRGEPIDLYYFGYGREYRRCLKDFYVLCGKTPLLPRWAFGNWWSRYHRYTDEEYRALVERFEREEIPFSVAVIDMDWHLVDDVDPKYGSGWTGYTWNREFFPDPADFLKFLHEHHMKTTLNVHPADGCRAYEKPYPEMAKAMGVDAEAGDPVDFDITNPKFLEAYFRYLHHPLEDEGVDFWWIDWQQGGTTKIPGLDPLWMLNHYHYLDSARRGNRPVTFSRYAGVGSHRYPFGFSGDTHITWESLDFQPYFTANASNVGYGWWSHDIGGHMFGYKDDELAARWVQLGVFSPILRLHSTDCPFNGKEPWNFNLIAETSMKDFLRLRHKLIPYLYTMNERAAAGDEPLVQPMYYAYPWEEAAYRVKNQFFFGSELMVCPITRPAEHDTTMGRVDAWLPEGTWIDFFNGMVYEGGRNLPLFRGLESMPVFAKAGAIVPMDGTAAFTNDVKNPAALEVRVFAGADGAFTLWEDAGDDNTGRAAKTAMTLKDGMFTVAPAEGDCSLIPASRDYTVKFMGFAEFGEIECSRPFTSTFDRRTNTTVVTVSGVGAGEGFSVSLKGAKLAKNDIAEIVYAYLFRAQIAFKTKEAIYRAVETYGASVQTMSEISAMQDLSDDMRCALYELIFAHQG